MLWAPNWSFMIKDSCLYLLVGSYVWPKSRLLVSLMSICPSFLTSVRPSNVDEYVNQWVTMETVDEYVNQWVTMETVAEYVNQWVTMETVAEYVNQWVTMETSGRYQLAFISSCSRVRYTFFAEIDAAHFRSFVRDPVLYGSIGTLA